MFSLYLLAANNVLLFIHHEELSRVPARSMILWSYSYVWQTDLELTYMTFPELCGSHMDTASKRAYLVNGPSTATTIRIPENLKTCVAEAASLKGLSFSAYVRSCLLDGVLNDIDDIERQ